MDDNYFLSFAPQESRISYAPSFGITAIPWYARREYARRLSTIPYLSIREQQGASIIKKLTGRDVPVVIDPTFLIKREQWQGIANESTLDLPQEYILTYFIGIDSYIEDLISKVKKSFPDKRVINLVFDKTEYGPADFLLLISKASFVLTNSFHGAAFCINFNVPFLIGKSLKDMTPNSAFNRMENLLKELGLSDRICDRVNTFDTSLFNLDFASVNRRRQQLVDQSTKFLDDSINKVLNHR
jgi:hypothetical protein